MPGVHEQDMQMYDSDVNNTAMLSTSSSEMIDPNEFCFCINFAAWYKKIVRQMLDPLCSCILKGCRCEINSTYSFVYIHIATYIRIKDTCL